MRLARVKADLAKDSRQLPLYDDAGVAADRLGRSRSDFMLEAACKQAEDVLLDQTYFALDTKSFAAFQAMLDRPETELLGLRGLFLEAKRGNADAAVAAYKQARSLNPRSVLKIARSRLFTPIIWAPWARARAISSRR